VNWVTSIPDSQQTIMTKLNKPIERETARKGTTERPNMPKKEEPRCFRIIRFFAPHINRKPRTIKNGLTETEAQAHCSRDDTRKEGQWFDGYDYMKGCRP
jgi:hypothetical protein